MKRIVVIGSIVVVVIFLLAITMAALMGSQQLDSQNGSRIATTDTSLASDGISFYASYAPNEIISALNNLTAMTSITTLSLGSSIYTGLGYFQETFSNGTGAISGTYEDNAMLIQLYYDNISFNLAIEGSNGFQYGIPVSNTTVVYFIPHHINVTSEMTLLMFYVGVQYFLVYHHSLYRNVKEGNMKVKSTENTSISDSVAGGSFVPYIVCCHPGDCSCSEGQTWTGSGEQYVVAEISSDENCEVASFDVSASITYLPCEIVSGTLSVHSVISSCFIGVNGEGLPEPYNYYSGYIQVSDTKGLCYLPPITEGSNTYSTSYTHQDTTVYISGQLIWNSVCGSIAYTAGSPTALFVVPQLTS